MIQIDQNQMTTSRNPRQERQLWDDQARFMSSLGCGTCPEVTICGGLHTKMPLFDCLDFCCGNPRTCDNVCRSHPDYADRVREVNTFALDSIPRTNASTALALPNVIPMLFHASSRELTIAPQAVALPLYGMFSRRDGTPRFASKEALCAAYRIAPGTAIVLSGTDRDAPLERWWGFGIMQRRKTVRALSRIGVDLVTTPNYSLFTDAPRWSDLHSIKRIALVHHEFVSEGLPAALHVNSRTETDFLRWTEYIAGRPEITHVAYEFTTGASWAGRRAQHAAWLCELASAVKRPIYLLVRGGSEILPELARSFTGVTVIETSSFIKTMMRRRASLSGNSHIEWLSAPTAEGATVDDLFAHNMKAVNARLMPLATAASIGGPDGVGEWIEQSL